MTPSGRSAIAAAFSHLIMGSDVWVTSSVGTPLRRMTPCITQAVGPRARPVDQPSERTRGVLIVHEWGFPHPRLTAITQQARAEGWQVVHDCAHAFIYGLQLAKMGSTVAFSLPKLLPVTNGGLLANGPGYDSGNVGAGTGRDRDWLTSLTEIGTIRSTGHVTHWQRLDLVVQAAGLGSLDRLGPGIIPQAYRLRVSKQFAASQSFTSQHIESAPPFYVGWLALPCHADLREDYWQAVEVAIRALP